MRSLPTTLLLLAAATLTKASLPAREVSDVALDARSFNFVVFKAAEGQRFTSILGDMVVPKTSASEGWYLWPGLQIDSTCVYQNVLFARGDKWQYSSEFYCSVMEAWGDTIEVNQGDTLHFDNTLNLDGKAWTTTISNGGPQVPQRRRRNRGRLDRRDATMTEITSTYDIASKVFNQAVFAVETGEGISWTFGPLEFSNIKITSTGTSTDWCTNVPQAVNAVFSISTASAIINGESVTCLIEKLVLERPA